MTVPPRLRVVGGGRAGRSLAGALGNAGWDVVGILGRGDALAGAAAGTDLLVIATPDDVIGEVASQVTDQPDAVVAHLSGSLGLDVLWGHTRVGAIHPLVSLPEPRRGAVRLASGAWFALAGDPLVQRVVEDLHGRWFPVADEDRAAYHAAAVVASNHLVALLGQVERIAEPIGVPMEAYLDLARATLENVGSMGAAAALTGPAARGDWGTMSKHLDALDPSERPAYLAVATAARRLVADGGLQLELDEGLGELPPG